MSTDAEREAQGELLAHARALAFKCRKQLEQWAAAHLKHAEQLEAARAYVRKRVEQLEVGRRKHYKWAHAHAEQLEDRLEKQRGREEWFAQELARARGCVEQLEREQVAQQAKKVQLEGEQRQYAGCVTHLERTLD